MRLIRNITQYFISKLQFRKRVVIAKMRREIDRRAQQHGLSVDLPELVAFKEKLPKTMDDAVTGEWWCRFLIDTVDPWQDCFFTENGTFHVSERMFGGLLKPWTLADFHVPDHRARAVRIVVNKAGLHLFDAEGFRMVTFSAARCDPHRLADDGSRLLNAAYLVNHYTGIAIDWRELWQKYSGTFEKVDGTWRTVELSHNPATS